ENLPTCSSARRRRRLSPATRISSWLIAADSTDEGSWEDRNPQARRFSCSVLTAVSYSSRMTAGSGHAVGEHMLPVTDRLRVARAGQQDFLADIAQELLATGHRIEQGG